MIIVSRPAEGAAGGAAEAMVAMAAGSVSGKFWRQRRAGRQARISDPSMENIRDDEDSGFRNDDDDDGGALPAYLGR